MRYVWSVAVGVAVLLGTASRGMAESASVLLEKGIHLEETVGDLEAAVAVYRRIVADAKANRRHVAQAHFRLGMCLLKTKQEIEAAAAFDELIANFPEQTELVARARKHLPPRGFHGILKEKPRVR